MLELIQKIVFEVTGKDGLTYDTDFVQDLGLNSFDIMNIVCAFEDYYDTTIPTRDVWNLRQVKDMIAYMEAHGAPAPHKIQRERRRSGGAMNQDSGFYTLAGYSRLENRRLTAFMEDYLEMILRLQNGISSAGTGAGALCPVRHRLPHRGGAAAGGISPVPAPDPAGIFLPFKRHRGRTGAGGKGGALYQRPHPGQHLSAAPAAGLSAVAGSFRRAGGLPSPVIPAAASESQQGEAQLQHPGQDHHQHRAQAGFPQQEHADRKNSHQAPAGIGQNHRRPAAPEGGDQNGEPR